MAVGFFRIVFCLYILCCFGPTCFISSTEFPHGVTAQVDKTHRENTRETMAGASARAETCRFAGKVIDSETPRRLWINGEAADVMRKGADGRRISEPD